ncbi:MAG: nicotinate (nicotinamide) nucleotide adenylyltransferase [Bdellovibrionales bacterium]|nr:nicotinate (nicotinamide) nucleotide adenylyltransferase [Bdellovibrionales bacterium]
MNNDLIAIYGGTFDPFHMGHIYCIQSILEKSKIDRVFVVPAAQNPLKQAQEIPSASQRLEMARIGVADFDNVAVDDQEIKRGGKSYTVDTIKTYLKEYEPQQIHLVIGLDEFYQFHLWKNFETILESCNLIVVSRPGNLLPATKEDLSEPLQKYVGAIDRNYIALTTGRSVEFLRVKGLDIASTEIRKLLKTGRGVEKFLDMKVEEYIKENNLYPLIGPKIGDFKNFTEFCGDVLFSRKALNLRGYDLAKLGTASSDYVIIASGTSKRQTQSLGESLTKEVKNQYGLSPLSIEGMEEGRWVLIDYGQLIIHLFYDYVRMEYSLESLWKNGVDMQLRDKSESADENTRA